MITEFSTPPWFITDAETLKGATVILKPGYLEFAIPFRLDLDCLPDGG